MKITESRIEKWIKTGKIDKLITALKDGEWNIRPLVANALRDFEQGSVIDALTVALKDKNPDVRSNSHKSLNKFTLTDKQVNLINQIEEQNKIYQKKQEEIKIYFHQKKVKKEILKYSNNELLIENDLTSNNDIKEHLQNEIKQRGGLEKIKDDIICQYKKDFTNYSNQKLLLLSENSNEFYKDEFNAFLDKEISKRGCLKKLVEIVEEENRIQDITNIVKSFKLGMNSYGKMLLFFYDIRKEDLNKAYTTYAKDEVNDKPLMTIRMGISKRLLFLTDKYIYIVKRKDNVTKLKLNEITSIKYIKSFNMVGTTGSFVFNDEIEFDIDVSESVLQNPFPVDLIVSMLNSIVKRTTFSEEDKLKQNIEQETIINSEIKTSSHSNIDIELNNDSMDIPSQSKTSIDKPEFKTTYIHAIIGFILGLILLYISHFSNFEYHMVIRGTNISLGWFAIIYGIFKLFSPSKVLVKNEDDNSN